MHPRTSLGEVLYALRDEAGLTQKQVAEKAKVSSYHLSKIERGHVRGPRRDLLIRIAGSYGLDYSDIEAAVERKEKEKQRKDSAYPSFAEEERRRAAEVREKVQQLDVFLGLPGDEETNRR